MGYYGKVRTHGDFVTRGFSPAFVARWDDWLQRGMVAARERLGDAWLSHYLVMPVWCFALGAGVVDEHAYAGVLSPGLDAVGRYFPFAIAARIDDGAVPSRAWYEAAADLALSTLRGEFALAGFDARIEQFACDPVEGDRAKPRYAAQWWRLDASQRLSCDRLDAELFARLLVETDSVG
ncbi:type VI secretion system protein ImpM [Paraburkholderia sp. BL8N3]|jgi:type VI secretion system protein ImpM|nr:type VI secretion system-associated protein TagF [Paraburkholderia sp. BL8N3]TCK38898.1 type VI secretion system protein ImpM [Paraburkholderia sp. BL8N3]